LHKKILKKLFADGARDSHAPAGPHPPHPHAPGSRQQTRPHSTATACGYMSQQIGAVIFPAGRFGQRQSNRLARSLRGHFAVRRFGQSANKSHITGVIA